MNTPHSFRPGEIWADTSGIPINAHGGGILTHDGVYYWFGEHKTEGEAGNRAQVGVHVYQSADLFNWTDAGIALSVEEDPASEITRGCVLERPKVLFNAKTGKFVMWFHLEPKGAGYAGARTGVAIADSAAGPYQFLRSLRPNAGAWPQNVPEEWKRPLDEPEQSLLASLELPGGPVPWYQKHLGFRRDHEGGQMARDMTLFLDDDGSAYQIYASEDNGTLHVSRLTADFLGHSGHYVRLFPGRFHEAPAIMKHRGKYWLFTSGCTGWAPNPMRLSVADHPLGPWEELSNPCLGMGWQITNSFESQPTFILPLPGNPDAFIYLGDRWRPKNAIDGRYIWLPVEFRHGVPTLSWRDEWDLSVFA